MGSGKARTWLDLASSIFKAMDRELNIEWMDMPDSIKNQYQYFTEASMQKIKSYDIGQTQFSLEEAIQDYVGGYLLKDDKYL